jgi:carboxymethylenebutenolidase
MVQEQTVNKPENVQATPNLTPAQEALQAIWEEHLGSEFGTHSTEDALTTMVEDAYVNNIPVMTGGVGKPAVGEFYSNIFHSTDSARLRASSDFTHDRNGSTRR